MNREIRTALTVAGSDPSGGAGIQADLKTFHAHRVYGMAAITLLTVQNTQGVYRVELQPPDLVVEQVERVLEDLPPDAVKTGALGNGMIISVIAGRLSGSPFPLVVDPVMVSKHGAPLLEPDAVSAMKQLLRSAFLVTPNIFEAEALTGERIRTRREVEQAAEKLLALGAAYVLVKGGHLGMGADDFLCGAEVREWIPGERIDSSGVHGTGCVLSAAITAHLARGADIHGAVWGGKRFISDAIRTAPGLGRGIGPTNMFGESS